MFPYTEVPTGSLGQGLSVGLGMALNAKYLDKTSYRTYVLLGDSELAEGSVWEALESAAFYKTNNLVAIIDVNRLGQRGETMLGYDTESYYKKVTAFGWDAVVIDGHSLEEIAAAFSQAEKSDKPFCIIAKTVKGKGVSFLENKDGWHGKALSKEELKLALVELGEVDTGLRSTVSKPDSSNWKLDSKEKIIYEKVADKTLFWTDSYKRKVLKDSTWALWENYMSQWSKLYIEQQKTGYKSIEFNSLKNRKMDSIHALLDTTLANYERMPD
jgi:transketolase